MQYDDLGVDAEDLFLDDHIGHESESVVAI